MNQSAIGEVLNHPLSQELLARDLTRLAFIGLGGTPRSIPIGFTWNGAEIVMCTAENARKLPALRRNPAVALTIDTEAHTPKVLLIRGQAELDPAQHPRPGRPHHVPATGPGDSVAEGLRGGDQHGRPAAHVPQHS